MDYEREGLDMTCSLALNKKDYIIGYDMFSTASLHGFALSDCLHHCILATRILGLKNWHDFLIMMEA